MSQNDFRIGVSDISEDYFSFNFLQNTIKAGVADSKHFTLRKVKIVIANVYFR